MNLAQATKAKERIASYIQKTPLLYSQALSEQTNKKVWLKLETQQPTGAFKVRPAFNGILSHLAEARKNGVLTTSSGNFAAAVAYACGKLKVPSTIVMTDDTSAYKVEQTKKLGAEVVFCGQSFESRFEKLEEIQKERGSLVLHGFDSEETIAGNGTMALEITEQIEGDFALISPASGGGLISGLSSSLKEIKPACEVYGFQSSQGDAIVRSLEKGERVNIGKIQSIADALVASIPGERTFSLIQKFVDGFASISEDEILKALSFLVEKQKLIVEPGGAVSVAGLLSEHFKTKHHQVVCVISGGNIELNRLNQML